MIALKAFYIIPHTIIVYYLVLPLVMVFLVWARKYFVTSNKLRGRVLRDYDFAAVVTAHGQSTFIEPIVDSLKKQYYTNFMVYVVADKIDEDLSYLATPYIKILKPSEPLNSKPKSIQFAIDNFVRKHDAISVFDADNLVHPNFFKIMNDYFNMGYSAVQGRIKAKNLNTSAARVDAINETYYSFIDKYSRMKLGLSSGLWGLGFAIDLNLYKKVEFDYFFCGYDKKLQGELITLTNKIAYANDAVIFDEKTTTNDGLIAQRSKWLFGYFHYMQLGKKAILQGLKTLNFDKVNYGLNHMRPPIVLLFPAAIALTIIDFFVYRELMWGMIAAIMMFGLAFLLITIRYSYDNRVWTMLHQVPRFIVLQFAALFKSNKGKKHIHTPHTAVVHIEDVVDMYSR